MTAKNRQFLKPSKTTKYTKYVKQEPNKVLNPRKVYKVKETNFIGKDDDQEREDAIAYRNEESFRPATTRRNGGATERGGKSYPPVEITAYDLDLINETCELMKEILQSSKSRADLKSIFTR